MSTHFVAVTEMPQWLTPTVVGVITALGGLLLGHWTSRDMASSEIEWGVQAKRGMHRLIVFLSDHGDMTGDQVLGLRLTDLAGHAWDLSRAIDIDETLEPRVISAIWEQIQPLIPILPSTGVFAAPEGDIADDASMQAKLLHVLGRKG